MKSSANRAGELTCLAIAGLFATSAAPAGGPENAILLVDPSRPESLYVANYYRAARNIPPGNFIYLNPNAADFAVFANVHAKAVFGELDKRRLDDHADFMIAASPASFFINETDTVSDGCFAVTRFSVSGAFTNAFNTTEILAGIASTSSNRYFSTTTTAIAFDSATSWSGGNPAGGVNSRRYFIGAMLGYSGFQGNTLAETLALIDRSAAADGAHPPGTFYYEQTTDGARSGPRHNTFPVAVQAIVDLGGQAEHQMAILPIGEADCLGIMTGWADPAIVAASMTILPGAFCDHLTSYAATFDIASQEKVSAWITKGASGSWGTVEEPCNYPGKFPHARVHVYYFQGLTLGEACFRSVGFTPIQGLLYGDPLTRPHAHIPIVSVAGVPGGPVGGLVTLTPSATTTHPTAAIASFELLIDGELVATATPGSPFQLYTSSLADGWHDVRVLAYDDTTVRSVGRWVGSITVNNQGRSAEVNSPATTGDLSTPFQFNAACSGPDLREIRLLQNGRVLAAAPAGPATFTIYGQTLGAGATAVQAEALTVGGRLVRSPPLNLTIAFAGGTPNGQAPVSSNFTRRIKRGSDALVELPATFLGDLAALNYVIVSPPAQAALPAGQTGPTRVLTPNPGAVGTDSLTFRVDSPAGSSAVATVNIEYFPCPGDIDESGTVDVGDLALLLSKFGSGVPYTYLDGDQDGDRIITLGDLAILLGSFGDLCP